MTPNTKVYLNGKRIAQLELTTVPFFTAYLTITALLLASVYLVSPYLV